MHKFNELDNLIVSLSNSSCPKHNFNTELSDYQPNLSKIPTPYQLYWDAYQAQEAYFAKGKITEQEFLAATGQFDDADLFGALDFGNGLGGTR
jgi:hypothetical protein